jgi:hypothetical protein
VLLFPTYGGSAGGKKRRITWMFERGWKAQEMRVDDQAL